MSYLNKSTHCECSIKLYVMTRRREFRNFTAMKIIHFQSSFTSCRATAALSSCYSCIQTSLCEMDNLYIRDCLAMEMEFNKMLRYKIMNIFSIEQSYFYMSNNDQSGFICHFSINAQSFICAQFFALCWWQRARVVQFLFVNREIRRRHGIKSR